MDEFPCPRCGKSITEDEDWQKHHTLGRQIYLRVIWPMLGWLIRPVQDRRKPADASDYPDAVRRRWWIEINGERRGYAWTHWGARRKKNRWASDTDATLLFRHSRF